MVNAMQTYCVKTMYMAYRVNEQIIEYYLI